MSQLDPRKTQVEQMYSALLNEDSLAEQKELLQKLKEQQLAETKELDTLCLDKHRPARMQGAYSALKPPLVNTLL